MLHNIDVTFKCKREKKTKRMDTHKHGVKEFLIIISQCSLHHPRCKNRYVLEIIRKGIDTFKHKIIICQYQIRYKIIFTKFKSLKNWSCTGLEKKILIIGILTFNRDSAFRYWINSMNIFKLLTISGFLSRLTYLEWMQLFDYTLV